MKAIRLKREPLLVCGKCLKRSADGKAIRKALKAQAKARGAKLVRTSCLGLCPKSAVAVASCDDLANRTAVLMDAKALDILRMI